MAVGNVRLILETSTTGQANVVWKSLRIHAERIDGLAKKPFPSLTQLDASRELLQESFDLDFSKKSSPSWIQWGRDSKFETTEAGLLVTAPGFDTWQGHGVLSMVDVTGDFDVSLDMDIEKLENASPGGESVVCLQAEFRNESKSFIEAKFAKSEQGRTTGEIQDRRLNEDGSFEYAEVASVPVGNANQLRLARRDGVVYFLVRDTDDFEPKILGRLEVGDSPIRRGDLRVTVHTAGVGHETVVLLKQLIIHAEAIQGEVQP